MPVAVGRTRPRDFQDLMRYRIMDILLVSTPYDAFLLEEAGELSERMLGEFRNLDLHYAPGLTSVSTGAEALALARQRAGTQLIITTPNVADMNAAELARQVREAGLDVPVVLLAWDDRDLAWLPPRSSPGLVERAFLWHGDARVLMAIVKSVEDWRNVAHDTRAVGVQVIVLVEDNVRNYSSFLPALYSELLHHSQRVISEGLNLSQKILRMRARPKLLLCTTYEEAEAAFELYRENVLGVIADVEFPRGGEIVANAGAVLARAVKQAHPDIPIVLHSSHPENAALAEDVGADFLLKGSPYLLEELHRVMLQDFGFGDFVFRLPDGEAVARAADLRDLEERLATVPDASLLYHSARNHFSRWLKARTAFGLAHRLRPRKLTDYPTPQALREDLIYSIGSYRREQGRLVVADFERDTFDGATDFYRIGGGSLGGKARGLAFVRRLLSLSGLRHRYPGVEIATPATVVLGTDVFDRFLDDNDLRHFAIDCEDDEAIRRRFEAARFPAEAARDVAALLERATLPLAVRSSSLLEDSQQQPFTGVYDTLMLPNNRGSVNERTQQVLLAVRRVYASTFSRHAKAYMAATPYRLEEEKMAVMLQRIVGAVHGNRFYPEVSAVARSHNFYPLPPMRAADGIVALALGLGRAIVEGGPCLRFCPRYPRHVPQLSSVRDALTTTQREFWALPLDPPPGEISMREAAFALEEAEADGTLGAVASTYSPENDAIYDRLPPGGARVLTFAPLLKQELIPLAEIVTELLALGVDGMGMAVEVELAASLSPPPGRPRQLGVLQVRPVPLLREAEAIEIGDPDPATLLCRSRRVLGNRRLEGIRDLVVVDPLSFDRARSVETAAEIGRLNAQLLAAHRPYVLIGVGRWGSRDPWLGIPVVWDQVSGAYVIVECALRDVDVVPSQGSHFFHNLTSFNVGYFTIDADGRDGRVDWEWLAAQPATGERAAVRHLRLAEPLLVKMNGTRGEGVILKPASSSQARPS